MAARLLNVTHEEYRRDPSPVPSLTQSVAKVLVTRSPAHAWLIHPKLGNQRKEPTDALDRGAVLDDLLLGNGAKYVVLPYEEYRTKEARQARDDARASGRIPVKQVAYEELERAVIAIKANMAKLGINLTAHGIGGTKYAIEWDEDGVICRCELDHVFILDEGEPSREAIITDVKSCENAAPSRLARVIADFGYDIQHAAYTRALAALKPDLAGRIGMGFVFVEVEPPYAVVPVHLNNAFKAYGEKRWLKAVEIWRKCLERNEWPGYTEHLSVKIELPGWLLSEIE